MTTEKGCLIGRFVTLRPMLAGDAEVTYRWRSGERARLLNQGAKTVEQQAQWIAARPAGEYNYIIELKDGGAPVGMLSLVNVDLANGHAETGRFLIGEEELVRGIPVAVEAMQLLYVLAFRELKLRRLYGTIAAHNVRMIKWQKYLGMKEEGRLRQHYNIGGVFQDAVFMGILADEFEHVFIPRAKILLAAGTTGAERSSTAS
jgi:diamine N-acetyltransferase